MDVVPHPDFGTNRLIYLSYGKPNEDGSMGTTTVVRGRLEGDHVEDAEEIFESNAWGDNNNHFSGRMAFDHDGYLFLTVGDRQTSRPGSLARAGILTCLPRGSPPAFPADRGGVLFVAWER